MELQSKPKFDTLDAAFEKFEGIFSQDELDSLRGIFLELDWNCTGQLRLEDLQQFICNHGGTMDSDEVRDQWSNIDNTGDGSVNAEEFLSWMARARGYQVPQAVPQAEVTCSRTPSRAKTARFSMWGSQESLARRIKEEDDEKEDDVKEVRRRESEDKLDVDVDMSALTADIETLREQLDNERQRRLDLEAELYDLAVNRDADMGGAVPIAEYEKLRLAEQLAQEKLMQLAEHSAELEKSEQRQGEAASRPQEDCHLREPKRRSTLRRTSWGRHGRASWFRRRLTRTSGARASGLSQVQFEMVEGHGNISSSSDSDSQSDKSQISMSFKKEVRKSKDSSAEKTSDTVDQESLKKGLQEVLSEMRACQRVQDTAVDKVAVSLADKVLTLLREEPVNVLSASDVANRAAQIVQEQRNARDAADELPLGAQVELAHVRRNICSGLEDELADVQTQLRSCVATSRVAVSEQSDLCEQLAEQAKQLRLAVDALPAPFASTVPTAESVNALAEGMAEHLSEKLASIHAETAEVKTAVASAFTTLRSTLSSQQPTPIVLPPKQDKECFLVFSFDKLGLIDRINEAAFKTQFRECLLNLGADGAVLENVSIAKEGGSLLATICVPEAAVRDLEKLPLAGNVTIMGDVARVAPAVSEARRLNQTVYVELQGLRAQLQELAAAQPVSSLPTMKRPVNTLTPGFEGLWTAVVSQDDMKAGFQSAGAKCRAEEWLLENGIRSAEELMLSDCQDNFLKALKLDPVRQDRAREWLKRETMKAKSSRASKALIAACSSRERTKLEEALHLAEDANMQNENQYQLAKAALREVWEEEAARRADSLQAAYDIAVPPDSPDVVSHVLLISSADGAEEAQRLCDEAAYRSWVKWVPDDLSSTQENPEAAFSRYQGRLKREVEAKLVGTPPGLHFSFIFLSTSPFAHCTQEKLVDIANNLKLEVAQKSRAKLCIGVFGFSHVEDCRRYLQDQAHEQRNLHGVLKTVDRLRSELKQIHVEREEQQVDELQQLLGVELQNVCAMRKSAEQAMSSLRLKHLEKERRRLEGDKERRVVETEALELQACELGQKLESLQGNGNAPQSSDASQATDEAAQHLAALRFRLEKIQKQQRGIEALQATNAKVSEYTRTDADEACQHADELAALVRSYVQTAECPQIADGHALSLRRAPQVVSAGGCKLNETPEGTAYAELSSGELEERLTHAVLRARERNVKLTPLSWARVQIKVKPGNSGCEPHILENIKIAVMEEAGRSHVSLADIVASNVESDVFCTMRVADGTSVLAAVDALRAHSWRAEGLREVLEAAGVIDLEVAPKWPLDRIQAEIQLLYGYKLGISDLFAALVPVLADSDDLYSGAWERACWEAPIALQALVQMESMVLFEDEASSARFKDQLLPISAGRERGLAQVLLRQGACTLSDLMSDAAAAHRQLKSRLLPGASWSEVELNDAQAVPPGHVIRTWHSGSADPAPCAAHYDPGLEREDRVLAAARRMMRVLDVEPRLDLVFNISCLDIVFESAECLRNAVDWLLKNLDVVWLENHFGNPCCLGYRDITIGVRWFVADSNLTDPLQRLHINEIHLSLKELHDKKRNDGCTLCGEICSGLAKLGVQAKDLDDVWKLILHLLDCTDGRAALNAQRHLAYAAELASSLASRSEGSIAVLAKELLEEAALEAVAVGVAVDKVNRVKTKHSKARATATSAVPRKAAAQQPSREGACRSSDTTILAESDELGALQPNREDLSATIATTMSLTNSMREQLQILSEAVDLDDAASPQQPRDAAVDAAESAAAVELLAQCDPFPVFSDELLQLRTQIAGLKEHAERTEELQTAVLEMLHAGAEPESGDHSPGMLEQVSAGGAQDELRPTVRISASSERELATKEAGEHHRRDDLADRRKLTRESSPQVDKWRRHRQSRWSRWLREMQQGDTTLPPATAGECAAEEEPSAEAEVEGNDEGLYMLELLQRLQRQAPHWEANLRLRSTEAQLSDEDADLRDETAEEQLTASKAEDQAGQNTHRSEQLEQEVQEEEAAAQDADLEQERTQAHSSEMPRKQIDDEAVSKEHQERHRGDGAGDENWDGHTGGKRTSMKELLHREERMRQEAQLERVLQRLQERLLMQEQGQAPLEATTAQKPREQVPISLEERQPLPCQTMPHLRLPEPQPWLRPMLPPSPAPKLLRLPYAGDSDMTSAAMHGLGTAREQETRLSATCSSISSAVPAMPPPALRDERPRAQGAAPEISPRGLPSLRPTARFAERANLETPASCGAPNNLPLDNSAVVTA